MDWDTLRRWLSRQSEPTRPWQGTEADRIADARREHEIEDEHWVNWKNGEADHGAAAREQGDGSVRQAPVRTTQSD